MRPRTEDDEGPRDAPWPAPHPMGSRPRDPVRHRSGEDIAAFVASLDRRSSPGGKWMLPNLLRRAPVTLTMTLALAAIAAAAGCSKQEGGAAGATGARTFAEIPKGTTHEFWVSIHAGAEKAGKEAGVAIDWKGPPREDDRQQQINV